MFPKISLIAAFTLMVAPPMACASRGAPQNRASASGIAVARGIVVAQENQGDQNDSDADNDNDNDNDNDSTDSGDANQNGDNGQMEQQNADNGNEIPPQTFENPDGQPGEAIRVPPLRGIPGQMNPNE